MHQWEAYTTEYLTIILDSDESMNMEYILLMFFLMLQYAVELI